MKITGIIIIVLIIAVVGVGGYFAYANYFAGKVEVKNNNFDQPGTIVAKGPKDTYIEAINKLQQAGTLDEALDITSNYTYFSTVAEKETAVADTKTQIQALTDAQKVELLQSMKDLFKFSSTADIKETINGNNATLDMTSADGAKSTMNLIKAGNVWLIMQQ